MIASHQVNGTDQLEREAERLTGMESTSISGTERDDGWSYGCGRGQAEGCVDA